MRRQCETLPMDVTTMNHDAPFKHDTELNLKQLQYIKNHTWAILQCYTIDQNDSRNVGRWEKLSKLYLQLVKQIDKAEAANKDTEIEIEV
jgi:hypothetical protein